MKTIIYFIAFVAASIFISNNVSAQYDRGGYAPYPQAENDCRDNSQQSLYYYPQSNVYYNIGTQQYIFPVHGSWTVAYRLPHYIWLENEPRFVVNHNGYDVWNENRFHVERFKNYGYSHPDVAYNNDRRFDRRNDDRFEHHDRDHDYRRW